MFFEYQSIDPQDRITRTDFQGFLYRLSVEQNCCCMVFAPFGVVKELDSKELVFVKLENPKFTESEVSQDQMDEIDELEIEDGCLLVYNAFFDDPFRFEGSSVEMWRGVADTRYFHEIVVRWQCEKNQYQAETRLLQKRIDRASSYLEKAIDRAKRLNEFRSDAESRHEISALKGALRSLQEE